MIQRREEREHSKSREAASDVAAAPLLNGFTLVWFPKRPRLKFITHQSPSNHHHSAGLMATPIIQAQADTYISYDYFPTERVYMDDDEPTQPIAQMARDGFRGVRVSFPLTSRSFSSPRHLTYEQQQPQASTSSLSPTLGAMGEPQGSLQDLHTPFQQPYYQPYAPFNNMVRFFCRLQISRPRES
jgi:hypothetical protein